MSVITSTRKTGRRHQVLFSQKARKSLMPRPSFHFFSLALLYPLSLSQADMQAFRVNRENTAIAKAVTVLKNLEGIPNRVNNFKAQVFKGNLTGKGYPGTGDGATFFTYFGPAVQKYLKDHKNDDTNGKIGDQLKSIGNNNQKVKDYYTSYASFHYNGCIDYLSTWSGRPTETAKPKPKDCKKQGGMADSSLTLCTPHFLLTPSIPCSEGCTT